MFSSHKQLVDTPRNGRRAQRGTGLEFTPIGGLRKSSVPTSGYFPMLQRNMATKSNVENGSPVRGNNMISSSFDETFDLLNDDEADDRVFRGADILPDFSDNETEHVNYERGNHAFVENGSNLLRKQHDQVKTLQEENLNLRIELLTLRKYLDGQPKDKVEILNQNVELSQENVNLRDKLDTLQQQLREEDKENLASRNDKQLRTFERQIEQLEAELQDRDALKRSAESERQRADRNEDEVINLQQELRALEDERDKLEASHEDLKLQLRNARTNLDSQHDSNDKIGELVDNLNDANKFIDEVGKKLDSQYEENETLRQKVDTLESKNEDLKSKNHRLSEILDQLKDEIKSLEDRKSNTELRKLEDDNRHLQEQVEDLYDQHRQDSKTITNLQLELKRLEAESDDKMSNESYIGAVDEEKNSLYDNIIELNDKLKDYEHRTKHLQRELQAKQKDLDQYEDELKRLKNASRGGNNEDLMDTIESLQNKLIQERNRFVDEVNKLDSKLVDDKEELYNKIEQLKREKLELVEDYEKLQLEHKRFVEQMSKTNKESELLDLERDFKKLSFSYANKCHELEDKEYESESLIRDLKEDLRFKENETRRLLAQIEKLTSQLSEHSGGSDQKVQIRELLQEKTQLEDKYRDSLLENSRLKRQIDSFSVRDTFDKSESLVRELKEANRDRDELRSDLLSKKKELADLKWKLDDVLEEKKQLMNSLSSLDEDQQRVSHENSKLSRELESLKLKLAGPKLKNEIEEKDREIKKLVNDYNEMKNDLLNRYEQVRKDKFKLGQELEEMKIKLERAKVAHELLLSKQMQRTEYPLSPVSPPRSPHENGYLTQRINLLESQKQLFRMKLQQYKDYNSDLQFMANFLTHELESKERMVTSLERLSGVKRQQPKLTFRAVALAVVAGVRFKNRLEQVQKKKIEERHVKKTIGRYREQTVDV
ncbi:hypothetical protein OGAPHI_001475 [Ogataea philodendri]|uniref:Centrosomin N-terminal motif 1 domain-containing protein n=1 Tax=Ogataea philodendri TaxID=1378263 RepID=A0A9P8PDB0_9ASCO|nr:uncharacterized protein OGAPHI_001475 [Ogataea philodendri]KAH3669354.1 hypothetical protein OGAPHI_001475 [Ogataea philodendri]